MNPINMAEFSTEASLFSRWKFRPPNSPWGDLGVIKCSAFVRPNVIESSILVEK
jgi:hypothetical protein